MYDEGADLEEIE